VADELTSLEAAIGRAAAADAFPETRQLLGRYVDAVERRARATPRSTEELAALAGRAHKLFASVHALVLAARASDAAESARLKLLARYRPPILP